MSGGRSRLAIHSMLLGSSPSVSMNSFTASQAFRQDMSSPTGSGVSCKLRTNSRFTLKSPFELKVSRRPSPRFE